MTKFFGNLYGDRQAGLLNLKYLRLESLNQDDSNPCFVNLSTESAIDKLKFFEAEILYDCND